MVRNVRTAYFALIALMSILFGIDGAVACSVPLIRTFANQTSTGYMSANSGKPCKINFVSASGPVYSTQIVQAPANGTAQVIPLQHVVYRSRAGFVGNDHFTYARRGLDKLGNPSVRTIEVAVTVGP